MAASMRTPVVVILGATGTGKTKLSLELARLFGGEIISADSMQIYKGLDVITNKASAEEQKVCPHHMIDYLSPHKTSTVQEYSAAAVPIMTSILDNKKLPLIVGGTVYYIGALLWNSTIIYDKDIHLAKDLVEQTQANAPKLQTEESGGESDKPWSDSEERATDKTMDTGDINRSEYQRSGSDNEHSSEEDGEDQKVGVDRSKYKDVSSTVLYKRLSEVDPETAARLHPHNRRKIVRALEVYDKYRLPMSEVYRAQQVEREGHSQGGSLRHPDTCVFWLQCEQQVLDERLDARVDSMVEQGLLQELTDFHRQYNEQRLLENREADYTTGIFQSLGFKEFHDYLMLSEEERQADKGKQLFEKGVADLKLGTRKYARYQIKRIRRLFFGAAVSQNRQVPVYGLDCTDVSRWGELVSKPAVDILSSLVMGEKPSIPPLEPEVEAVQFERNECQHCDVVCVTQHEWEKHKKSKAHKAQSKKHKHELQKLSSHLEAYVSQKSGNPRKSKTSLKEMQPTSARVRVSRSIRVQGQGYSKQDIDPFPDGSGASGAISNMSFSSDTDGAEADEFHNPAIVDELVGINRTLEKQIETLRLRLEFDKKHHEDQKSAILTETGTKLKSKLEEVNKLQNQLHAKDMKLLELTETNHKRDSEIGQLKRQIETLNEDVNGAKSYANELVEELAILSKERERLRGEGLIGDKDVEITALRKEVTDLKLNLTTLESELTKAREVMKNQAGHIKFQESDKKTIQLKFKEELAKVTYSMRLEVEKMRDVMKSQWEEMRALREQNTSMSQDIKDIRSLLMNGCLDDDAKLQQEQEQDNEVHGQAVTHTAVAPSLPVPQTARGGKTVYNQFSMGAMKPSLPLLNKDVKKSRLKVSRSAMK